MASPKWLEEYYGPDFDILNPTVVQEGVDWAIVRLTKAVRTTGSSNIGYVLIQKKGRHVATPHVSLHEGVAQEEDLTRMQKTLKEKDTKFK
jgi:hypothetical protein